MPFAPLLVRSGAYSASANGSHAECGSIRIDLLAEPHFCSVANGVNTTPLLHAVALYKHMCPMVEGRFPHGRRAER